MAGQARILGPPQLMRAPERSPYQLASSGVVSKARVPVRSTQDCRLPTSSRALFGSPTPESGFLSLGMRFQHGIAKSAALRSRPQVACEFRSTKQRAMVARYVVHYQRLV